MTLRIMLLGLVASMGFELPSGSDFTRWTESGREWVTARLADPTGPGVAVLPLDVLPTDCLQADESCHAPIVVETPKSCDDKAFEAVADAITADFAADLLVNDTPESKPGDMEPALVLVEGTPAIGLPSTEDVATPVISDEIVPVAEMPELAEMPEAVASVDQPEVVAELTGAMHERLDRIGAAVRLTREAVQAWAEVVQDPVDETSPAY